MVFVSGCGESVVTKYLLVRNLIKARVLGASPSGVVINCLRALARLGGDFAVSSLFPSRAPESAPLKSKMIYASSKDAIKKKLTGKGQHW